MKVQTEALLCAAQEQNLRINNIKHHTDKTTEFPCEDCFYQCSFSFFYIICKAPSTSNPLTKSVSESIYSLTSR